MGALRNGGMAPGRTHLEPNRSLYVQTSLMQLWSSTTDPTEPRRPVEFANHHGRGRLRELRKFRAASVTTTLHVLLAKLELDHLLLGEELRL